MLQKMVEYLHINLTDTSSTGISICNQLSEAIELVKQNKRKCKNLTSKYKDEAQVFVQTAKDSIMLRRLQVIGLKMRIYYERQKAVNAMEFLRLIKNGKVKEVIDKDHFKN